MVARRAHNPEAAGSNPASATNRKSLDFVDISTISGFFLFKNFIAYVLKIDIKYHRKPQKCKSTCKSKVTYIFVEFRDIILLMFLFEMGIYCKRRFNVGMTHLFLSYQNVDSRLVHHRAESVAQTMEREWLNHKRDFFGRELFDRFGKFAVLQIHIAQIAFKQSLPAAFGHHLSVLVCENKC